MCLLVEPAANMASPQLKSQAPGDVDCTEEQQQYITLPLYQADDSVECHKGLQGMPVQEVAELDQSAAGNLAYQDPPQYVLAGQEVSDATHVIYDTGSLPKQAVSQGELLARSLALVQTYALGSIMIPCTGVAVLSDYRKDFG